VQRKKTARAPAAKCSFTKQDGEPCGGRAVKKYGDPAACSNHSPEKRAATADAKSAFLEALEASGGTIGPAAHNAGIARRMVWIWKETDPEFALAMVEVIEHQTDRIVAALFTRAVDGVVTDVRYDEDGNVVSRKITYSDTAAIALLKARRRDEYGDRSDVNVTHVERDEDDDARLDALMADPVTLKRLDEMAAELRGLGPGDS